jgi:hypothetical protein
MTPFRRSPSAIKTRTRWPALSGHKEGLNRQLALTSHSTVCTDGSRTFPFRFRGSQVSSEQYRVRLSSTISTQVHLKLLRHGHTDSVDGTFAAATEEPDVDPKHARRASDAVKETDGGRVYPNVVLIPDTRQPEYGSRVAVPDPGRFVGRPGPPPENDGKGVAFRLEEGAAESVESQ